MKKPKAIIFDWDNTLADTWPVIHEALHNTFTDMGHTPWTLEETKLRVHRSLRDSFPALFGERWEEAGLTYQRHYQSLHLTKLYTFPMASDVLELLKTTDIYVALVSNKRGDNLRKELGHIKWLHYFDRVVGATDAAEDKPSPAPVLLAFEGTDITPGEDVWFIGDSVTDMECAHNTGCLPIFYGDDDPTSDRYKHCPPIKHLHNHGELLELIRTLL